eukprot:10061679-Alexandrium_andersonii.AAC.1
MCIRDSSTSACVKGADTFASPSANILSVGIQRADRQDVDQRPLLCDDRLGLVDRIKEAAASGAHGRVDLGRPAPGLLLVERGRQVVGEQHRA